MTRLGSCMVRASMVHLLIGFSFGALILLQKGGFVPTTAWRLLSAHVDIMLIGWVVQLAMGVAFWILPRYAPPEPRTRAPRPRGDERPVWAAFVLLNLGVAWTAAGAWLGAEAPAKLIGRLAVAFAVALFASHAWGRVKPIGR